ncbi:hypothetical protein [Microbacterium karelineae]|uniref:hypothetical protein n=1 Tax=Microbacterium karelineae TaxID=2654283 RepID=UPI0012EAAB9F|nr:hypothetical protein [Microbacterium karelineae]
MTADLPTSTSIAARRTFVGESFRPATVRITDGRVSGIGRFDAQADTVVDDTHVLIPGLVDLAGDGSAAGTSAAAQGGVTTLATTSESPAAQRQAASEETSVDVARRVAVVPETLGDIAALLDAGAIGLSCGFAAGGADGALDAAGLERALSEVAAHDSALAVSLGGPSEADGVRAVADAARRTGGRAHIVRLATAEGVEALRWAKADGANITAAAGADDADGLWDALADGTIDAIAGDIGPSAFASAWAIARGHGLALEDVLPLLAERPAAVLGISRGEISRGAPAHLIVIDPADGSVVSTFLRGERVFSRDTGVTAHLGREVLADDDEGELDGVLALGTGTLPAPGA